MDHRAILMTFCVEVTLIVTLLTSAVSLFLFTNVSSIGSDYFALHIGKITEESLGDGKNIS